MQNVITCPRANVSSFFYKRKLNIFNLTAHCSLDKKAYNALWAECIAGRGANEIASALQVILCTILKDHPTVDSIILWSDSCVPQNRNSVMSLALKTFMIQNPSVKQIIQKYCTPGHSSIQEVDIIHSHLEKGLRISEIYSPVSLIRVLRNIRPKYSKVIQLQKTHFYNFENVSKAMQFCGVPYSKVKELFYVSEKPFHLQFKTSFADKEFTEVSIRGQTTRNKDPCPNVLLPMPKNITKSLALSKEKKEDFRSMLKFMPLQDREFFEIFCQLKKK